MKVLVLGSTGMLGRQMLLEAQSNDIEVVGLSHQELDVTNYQMIKENVKRIEPEVVINCTGIVKGRVEVPLMDMLRVNTHAPIRIAALCSKLGIRMVHVSTDCVYCGDGPHIEKDRPTAKDLYGITKYTGEVIHDKHLTVRCSFIGIGQRGLLSWLFKQSGDVHGYENVLWNGMTAKYAARVILGLALTNIKGLIHIFGEDTTKYNVLDKANEVFKLGLNIIPMKRPMADNRLRSSKKPTYTLPSLIKQLGEMNGEEL